jgi:hypothetical protein
MVGVPPAAVTVTGILSSARVPIASRQTSWVDPTATPSTVVGDGNDATLVFSVDS